MKEIKDYMNLYLGCECQLFWRCEDDTLEFERIGVLTTIQPENQYQNGLVFKCKTGKGNFVDYAFSFSDIKPILRPLSDMTEEEEDERDQIWNRYADADKTLIADAEQTIFLLSKHFDLFGLIEAGLAIDKTKINK